jgi:hypothetical protein
MATVTIENAEVFKIIDGYGFKAVEKFRLRSGEEGKRYYTVWTKEAVKQGDILTIEGELFGQGRGIHRQGQPAKDLSSSARQQRTHHVKLKHRSKIEV